MSLHEQRGVKDTTISDIAEKAGVERLTVYRHFPDDFSLFRACSGHWFEMNPLPDPAAWKDVSDPRVRTERVLTLLYSYYKGTQAMWNSILRDEEMPAIKTVMKSAHKYFRALTEDLTGVWQPDPYQRKSMEAAVSHSLQFYTWQSFRNQRLSDTEITRLMIRWLRSINAPV